jgi:16S rRNA (guanine527-N7)-methyltransferase
MQPPLTPEAFQKLTGVSRETLQRLEAYAALLTAWNRRINLVGPKTLGDLWRRHILDSAQLLPHLPPGARRLVDLGSGAGLPGLVLAILGIPEVHLVESDGRKAAFLREAARIAAAPVRIHAQRAEKVPGFAADIITARAFAPLPDLLDHGSKFASDHTIWYLLKGQSAAAELAEARAGWSMEAVSLPSLTDPSGTILRLAKVRRGASAHAA